MEQVSWLSPSLQDLSHGLRVLSGAGTYLDEHDMPVRTLLECNDDMALNAIRSKLIGDCVPDAAIAGVELEVLGLDGCRGCKKPEDLAALRAVGHEEFGPSPRHGFGSARFENERRSGCRSIDDDAATAQIKQFLTILFAFGPETLSQCAG